MGSNDQAARDGDVRNSQRWTPEGVARAAKAAEAAPSGAKKKTSKKK